MNVSILGAGSTYGVFLVKWALQLKHNPETNREKVPIPPIGVVSYSNVAERNVNLVKEVLLDDISRMSSLAKMPQEQLVKDVHGYTNWREMLTKESPGLIIICSPLATHIPYMRELLSDFKVPHILCEPPLSSIQEMDALPKIIQLAKEKNVTLGVNQQYAILYDILKSVPINPEIATQKTHTFSDLLTGLEGLELTFITHGTRLWRRMEGVGEREILEDLGPHIYELIPPQLRSQKLQIRNVKKEGDNLFLNFVEYDILLGAVPVKITLGYHRKLKSMKILFKKEKKSYEFHISGTTNPETGEYTRWIEGKNYAYKFKHFLNTDLVKSSFISSLAGKPVAPAEEGIRSLEFIRALINR